MRNNHVKAVHQKSVGVTYSNGVKKQIGRSTNGLFTCICNREFSLGDSLRRHAKMCEVEKETFIDSNQGEEGNEIDVELVIFRSIASITPFYYK